MVCFVVLSLALLLAALATTNAFSVVQQSFYARQFSLSMNVENLDTKDNIKVGVIGA